MEFEILGPLRVRSNGGDLKLGAPAQRELLAVLLTPPNVTIPDWSTSSGVTIRLRAPVTWYRCTCHGSARSSATCPTVRASSVRGPATRYASHPNELDAERFVANLERGRALRGARAQARRTGPGGGDRPVARHPVRRPPDHTTRGRRRGRAHGPTRSGPLHGHRPQAQASACTPAAGQLRARGAGDRRARARNRSRPIETGRPSASRRNRLPQLPVPSAALIAAASSSALASISAETYRFTALMLAAIWSPMFVA